MFEVMYARDRQTIELPGPLYSYNRLRIRHFPDSLLSGTYTVRVEALRGKKRVKLSFSLNESAFNRLSEIAIGGNFQEELYRLGLEGSAELFIGKTLNLTHKDLRRIHYGIVMAREKSRENVPRRRGSRFLESEDEFEDSELLELDEIFD